MSLIKPEVSAESDEEVKAAWDKALNTKSVYTIASMQSRTYGHGSHGEELVIEKSGGYGTGEFPPVFTSLLDAEAYFAALDYKSGKKIVSLELK